MSLNQTTTVLDDLSRLTPNMVEAAIAVTTGRMHLGSPDEALALLQSGDPAAVAYYRYELARQVAVALLRLDHQVIAVFEEQIVPEADELAPDVPRLHEPLPLRIHVRFHTAASRSLIAGLARSIAEAIEQQFNERPITLLDTTIIETPSDSPLDRRRLYRPPPILLAARDQEDTLRAL